MTTIVKNDIDEARVIEAAEHVRKKLTEFIELDSYPGAAGGKDLAQVAPVHKDEVD